MTDERTPGPKAAFWWLCPNDPPCPHGNALHDIEALGDPLPTCCADGCTCGHDKVMLAAISLGRLGRRLRGQPHRRPRRRHPWRVAAGIAYPQIDWDRVRAVAARRAR